MFFNVSCMHVCGTCLCQGTQVFAYVYQMPEEDRDNLRWHNSGTFYLLFWARLSLWAREYFRLGASQDFAYLCLLNTGIWVCATIPGFLVEFRGGQSQLFLLVKWWKVSTISHHIYKTETCPPWGMRGNSNIPSQWGCQDLTLTTTDTTKGSEPSSFSKMAEPPMNRPSINTRAGAMKFQSEEFIMWSQIEYREK